MRYVKWNAFSGIMLTLLLVSTLTLASSVYTGSANFQTNKAAEESTTRDFQFTLYDTKQSKKGNSEQARIIEHKVMDFELRGLIEEIGVWEEHRNYNQIINGYGTGLRPPTEEEWVEIAGKTFFVEKILLGQTAPSSIDHTIDPSFPPIGHQDGEGSCTAWAVGYYMKTFQEAKEHEWDLSGAEWEGGYYGYPTTAYQNRIFSPDFIYHLINYGVDGGSSVYRAMNLIASIGACSWEKMPYDPDDHTSWPSEQAWREAPLYRGNSSGSEWMDLSSDDDLESLKNWIASNQLAVITVDASKYSSLTNQDIWTLDNYVDPSTNHANTIAGYDDDIEYVEQGETRRGAFKVVNSWGEGGWENIPDGCYWISYEAMKQRVGFCRFYRDIIGYEPELVASFELEHSKRAECLISVGVGDEESPIQEKRFYDCVRGGDHPFCPNNILFDITEFKDAIPTIYDQPFFLEVYDEGSLTTGTIKKFAIEYAQSQDPPLDTVNYDNVFASVTLLPLETSWVSEKRVCLDEDFIDNQISIAVGGNEFLYVAYEDWYPLFNHQAIFVQCSIDGGNTWELMVIGYDSTHDLRYPSIAIDPFSDDIFVAVEREWTVDDHDIFVMRYVGGAWSWSAVANVLGSDDRFPSITSEYSYGGVNWQYISYEYVYNFNDRDLMFAKSTDHGATWSVMKLHGGFPDYNVHAQTCITNAEGYIYIAYKWGWDYDSVCEIRVDRSTDFGDSWTQFTDVDGLPNDCSLPSIAATHGGNTVMVAFQYEWSGSDIDVWYSYSSNKGSSWTKGRALYISGFEDETQPSLTVDGEGTTSNDIGGHFYAVCKSSGLIRYKKAHYNNLLSWSNSEYVNARWVDKGLVATTQLRHDHFFPCIAWTCGRTRDIYFSTRESGTIVVPDDYSTIQKAINHAHETETIYVNSGTYYENVIVNKTVSLIGESPNSTIVNGNENGQVIRAIADNVVIENFTITNAGWDFGLEYCGITLESVDNCTIKKNDVVSNPYGILLNYSSNNSIYGNSITNNMEGIWLRNSFGNSIHGNNVAHNDAMWSGGSGIIFSYSSNNTVSGNNITNNGNMIEGESGIIFSYSSNNTVSGNIIEDNAWYGIEFWESSSNIVSENVMNNMYNFEVYGSELSHYMNSIDVSNLVDGKPVYYLVNQKDLEINPETYPQIGYLALINCTNITVEGLTLEKNAECPLLAYTNSSKIINNTITNNLNGIILESSTNNNMSKNNITNNYWTGIIFVRSSDNIVSGNNITNQEEGGIIFSHSSNNTIAGNMIANTWAGVGLYWYSGNNCFFGNDIADNWAGVCTSESSPAATDNKFFHNNFIDNAYALYGDIAQIWDDGYPCGGNYWSDYSDVDEYHGQNQAVTGSDGVWDSPYEIDVDNQDRYPLAEPWDPPKIPGDVNKDGIVNVRDLTIVAMAYGCECEDLDYDRQGDLNFDGWVEMRDLTTVARNLLKTSP